MAPDASIRSLCKVESSSFRLFSVTLSNRQLRRTEDRGLSIRYTRAAR